MNSHFSRAHGPSAGFSFIELLVTIVIAGIAFVALGISFFVCNYYLVRRKRSAS